MICNGPQALGEVFKLNQRSLVRKLRVLGHQEVLKVVELLSATFQGGILGYSKSVHHTSASVVRPISFRLLGNYRQHYHGYHTKHLPC